MVVSVFDVYTESAHPTHTADDSNKPQALKTPPISTHFAILLALVAASCTALPLHGAVEAVSTAALERRLAEIDLELGNLARLSMRSGVGAIGFRSQVHQHSENTEWITISLEEESEFDRFVIVPTIWRDANTGFRADGFPEEFRVIAGSKDDPAGSLVASFKASDRLLPRVAPLAINCPNTKASWIRLEATRLSSRAWDGKYVLQLSEILIFNKDENIALQRPVLTSSNKEEYGARGPRFLVDGHTPYLMDASGGDHSIAFLHTDAKRGTAITVDLGEAKPVNRIHFHTLDLSDTVPQANEQNFGIPGKMIFEGAGRADFSDAETLAAYSSETIYDTGPIIMLRFPETLCRYVRLTVGEPYLDLTGAVPTPQFGAAEIEIFSKGENVTLGREFTTNLASPEASRKLSALTDGANMYGAVLTVRDWLGQLAKRHDLETDRLMIAETLASRYLSQKEKLKLLGWLSAILAAGIGFTILISRRMQVRKISELRERFAADLHDEIGANLHTIRLLGEVAHGARDSPERLDIVLNRNREIIERTSAAVRSVINLHQAGGLHENLAEDMHRAADRILAGVEHSIDIEGGRILQRLQPGARADLLLFFKECLVNISRHSGATRFHTRLTADKREVRFVIGDNGRGIGESGEDAVPPSLKRRARLLGAQVTAGNSADGGVIIILTFKPKKLKKENTRHE
jgi:signal transduction histidine kinase